MEELSKNPLFVQFVVLLALVVIDFAIVVNATLRY